MPANKNSNRVAIIATRYLITKCERFLKHEYEVFVGIMPQEAVNYQAEESQASMVWHHVVFVHLIEKNQAIVSQTKIIEESNCFGHGWM